MTNQRWRVVKANAPTSSGKIWQVWQANKRRKVLHTWREALDYADRTARTAEVTLPRLTGQVRLPAHNGTPGGHPRGYTLTPQNKDHYCAITIRGPWGECGIYEPQDIKPLALALLAHYYNSKDTPWHPPNPS